MITVQYVVLKHHKKSDGSYNVKFKITCDGNSSYISSSVSTDKVRFRKNQSSGIITDSSIIEVLEDKVAYMREILNRNDDVVSMMETSQEIKDFLLSYQAKKQKREFFVFADDYIAKIANQSTKAYHITRINAFRQYVTETYGIPRLPFVRLSLSLLEGYEKWLSTTNRKSKKADGAGKGLCQNSVNSYINALSIIFNAARREYNNYDSGDMEIKNDPFKVYVPPKIIPTRKRALDKETIKKIFYHETRKSTPMMAKDLFMMSFFMAGMNLVDIYECEPFTDRVEYVRKKTRGHKRDLPFISLPVHPLITDTINRYRDTNTGNGKAFMFHEMYRDMQTFHQAVRRGIGVLRRELNLPGLTYYAARHSFATIARNDCNVSMDDIAVCLTHESGHKITDTYVRVDNSRVDNVICKVIGYVFE